MEENEIYWSNLEKLFVHNVYERISSRYDDFLRYNENKYQSETNHEHFEDPNSDLNNNNLDNKKDIVNTNIPKEQISLKNNFKEKYNKSLSSKKNEWPKVRSFLLRLEPYSLVGNHPF